MAEEKTVPAALPANIKEYITLYSTMADGEDTSPLKDEARKAIAAFDKRVESFPEKTPDRFFLEEYKNIVLEGSLRKRARENKYKEERASVLESRRKALEELNSEKDYTGKGLKAIISRAIPVLASYKGLSTVLASADAVVAATVLVWGGTEIIISKVSKTQEEKIYSKYNARLQEIEDWFAHDKGGIYRDAEEKAENSYRVYYGQPSQFPEPRPKATEPPPKLYRKEKRSAINMLLFRK